VELASWHPAQASITRIPGLPPRVAKAKTNWDDALENFEIGLLKSWNFS